jgi:hypothetical protein
LPEHVTAGLSLAIYALKATSAPTQWKEFCENGQNSNLAVRKDKNSNEDCHGGIFHPLPVHKDSTFRHGVWDKIENRMGFFFLQALTHHHASHL